jgi:hypothetical protein
MAQREIPKFSPQEIEAAKRAVPVEIPRFSAEEIKAAKIAVPEERGFLDKAGFALRSALEGHTAGLSEPIIAHLKAAAQTEALTGNPFAQIESERAAAFSSPEYQAAIKADVENRKLDKAQMPGLDLGAQIAGGLVPSPVNVGGKVNTLVNAGLKGLKVADLAKDASLVAKGGNLLARAGKSGLSGALTGAGFEGTRQAALRVDGFLDGSDPSAAKSIGTAALYGGGIGAAIPVAGAALNGGWQGAKWVGSKGMESILGVSQKTQKEYLANSARIKGARTVEQIKDEIDLVTKRVQTDLENAKISKQEAQAALRDLGQQVKETLADAKWDAREALRVAESRLSEAWEGVLEPLKSKKAPTHLAGEVSGMVQELKGKVQRGSAAAVDVLDSSKEFADPTKVYGYIDDQIEKLASYGTKEADSIARELQDYKARLMTEHWAKIPAARAKRLIQGLDQITQYSANPTAFDKARNASFKGVRATLDEALKDSVDEYKQAMAPVAQDTALLSKGIERFGDPQRGVSTLGQIATPRGGYDLATLKQLEAATGKQGLISGAAEEFQKAQAVLKAPDVRKAMKEGLPEFKAYQEAVKALARRNPKATRAQIERAMEGSKEAKALAMAEAKLSQAEQAAEPLAGISQGNSENKIRSVMRGEDKNFEARKLLERVSEKAGKDFVREVDDRAILESFERGITNGSRNTVFGAAVGLAVGGVPGAMAGAAFGRTVLDRYGPKVGQIILDGIVKAKGSTMAQRIRNLQGVSPQVKQELEKSLFLSTINAKREPPSLKNVASTEEKAERAPTSDSAFDRRLKAR